MPETHTHTAVASKTHKGERIRLPSRCECRCAFGLPIMADALQSVSGVSANSLHSVTKRSPCKQRRRTLASGAGGSHADVWSFCTH
eukprot:scaffold139765_cov25-Tisochrysis_lutea.AAC.1